MPTILLDVLVYYSKLCKNTLCTALIFTQGYIERGLQTIEHEKMSGIPGELSTVCELA